MADSERTTELESQLSEAIQELMEDHDYSEDDIMNLVADAAKSA